MSASLPVASVADTARAVRDVLLPVAAQGAILRRPAMTYLAQRLAADERSLRQVRRLRKRYGEGPLLLRLPGRTVALVLQPEHVHRVLEQTPVPFSPAAAEKVGALRHFQPHAVLISEPALRGPRRELNEHALDSHQPVHRHAHKMTGIITEELDKLDATVGWTGFREIWSRAVRRIVLGDRAAGDTELTALLDTLRSNANWAEFHPRNAPARHRFQARLSQYVVRAEPGSLVEALDATPDSPLDPAGQVPHWLFAFDAAGIALWRLLALLGTHPEQAEIVAYEARHPQASPLLAQAGAAVQESLRLWPTTLVVLREATEPTSWAAGTAPAGTQFAIVSSVFHRDDQALPFANTFEPAIWLDGRSDSAWPLIPFSAGPAVCPGRNVVLLTTSAATSHVISNYDLDVDPITRADLTGRLPGSLDHSRIRIGFWRKQSLPTADRQLAERSSS
ncbi:cytochrome P450 [Kribbella sp. NPDC051620]|uniref:cytochrome P450 n=1 Tax=Kribbella sp. NPDC051620 TaxID=3364120 RepID=UPI00378B8774